MKQIEARFQIGIESDNVEYIYPEEEGIATGISNMTIQLVGEDEHEYLMIEYDFENWSKIYKVVEKDGILQLYIKISDTEDKGNELNFDKPILHSEFES